MDTLPLELLHEIASHNKECYRALLGIPLFARSLTPGVIVDYKLAFGHYVEICTNSNGDKYIKWTLNGKPHRTDGPAVEWADGSKEWYKHGKRHRPTQDGPAAEWSDKRKDWYIHGKLHRENGPAVECANGHKEWYINGELHRENGPAVECEDGTVRWYTNGARHRQNGPSPNSY